MYAYHPQFKKKKEKMLAWFFVALGAVLYITSQYPGAPVPGILQIIGVGSLAGSILLVSMCILRSYSYEIVAGEEEGKLDFVITEHYSRRKTVVCRVGLDEVVAVVPFEESAQRKVKVEKGKEKVYTYTGVLFDEKRYCVQICTQGEQIFVIICADEALLNILSKC